MIGAESLAVAERIVRLLTRAVRRIATTAKSEVSSDANRLVLGAATFGLAFVLCAHAVALLHGVVIFALLAAGVAAVEALAALLAVDLLIVLVAIAIGRHLVRQPVLSATRAQIHQLEETYELLTS
jgi:hypothetical protein